MEGPPGSGASQVPPPFSPSAASSSAVAPGSTPAKKAPLPPPRAPSSRPKITTKGAQAAAYAQTPGAQDEAARALARFGLDMRPLPPQRAVGEKAPRSEQTLLESFMEYTSVSLLQEVWGKENLDAWQERHKTETQDSKDAINEAKEKKLPIPPQKFRYPTARDLLEILSPAQKQCLAIIGEVKKDQPCYICGFPIGPLMPKNGLQPECEHILPVAQAVLLYDLYQPKDLYERPPLLPEGAPNRDPAKEKAFFANEYRWAHNVCNQVKSDDNIIAYKEGKGFYLDVEQLRKLITDIYNEARAGGPLIKKLVDDGAGRDAWIEARLLAVSNEVKDLLKFLNTQLLGGGDRMMALNAAANLISRVKVDFQNIPPVEVEAAGERFKEHAAEYGDDFLASYLAPRVDPGAAVAPEEAQAQAAAEAAASSRPAKRRKPEGGKRRKTYRMRRCRLPKLL